MSYLVSLLALLILDGIWLTLTTASFYKTRLAHLFSEHFTMWPVLFFYPVYALAITVLIVFPAVREQESLWLVAGKGALLGLAAYGAYDFTNQATLKNWPLSVTVVDLAWGALVTAVVSVISVWLARIMH